MHLKTYRAASIAQAMALIRSELGADALILSSRRVSGGVEVAACLETAADELSLPPAGDRPGPARAAATPQPVPSPVPSPMPPHVPWQPRQAAPPPAPRPGGPSPEAALAWHGVTQPLLAELAGGDLAHALAARLKFGALPVGPPPLLLTGAPGAGKTLTIARLATRLVLAGRLPLVISADGRRAGAAEELAAYTRLLGIELIVASKPATIARALPRRPDGAPVLIDTAGVNPFDPAQRRAMQDLAETAGAVTVLVLPAGQDPSEAAEQAEIFAATGVRHLIPTRLDIARRLGAILAAAAAGGMMLSEAGTGPGATDGLTRLSPGLLADWLSRISPAGAGPLGRLAPAPPSQAPLPSPPHQTGRP
jgi:flagellar biosynthesis protein FlhF